LQEQEFESELHFVESPLEEGIKQVLPGEFVGQEPEGDTKGLEQEFEEQWSEGNPFVKECDLDEQEFVGTGLILQEQEFEGERHMVESPLERATGRSSSFGATASPRRSLSSRA
jgi:hypothetical protein